MISRHADMSRRFVKGIKDMGLEMFVEREVDRVPTVNGVKIPATVDSVKAAKYAMMEYVFVNQIEQLSSNISLLF